MQRELDPNSAASLALLRSSSSDSHGGSLQQPSGSHANQAGFSSGTTPITATSITPTAVAASADVTATIRHENTKRPAQELKYGAEMLGLVFLARVVADESAAVLWIALIACLMADILHRRTHNEMYAEHDLVVRGLVDTRDEDNLLPYSPAGFLVSVQGQLHLLALCCVSSVALDTEEPMAWAAVALLLAHMVLAYRDHKLTSDTLFADYNHASNDEACFIKEQKYVGGVGP